MLTHAAYLCGSICTSHATLASLAAKTTNVVASATTTYRLSYCSRCSRRDVMLSKHTYTGALVASALVPPHTVHATILGRVGVVQSKRETAPGAALPSSPDVESCYFSDVNETAKN